MRPLIFWVLLQHKTKSIIYNIDLYLSSNTMIGNHLIIKNTISLNVILDNMEQKKNRNKWNKYSHVVFVSLKDSLSIFTALSFFKISQTWNKNTIPSRIFVFRIYDLFFFHFRLFFVMMRSLFVLNP